MLVSLQVTMTEKSAGNMRGIALVYHIAGETGRVRAKGDTLKSGGICAPNPKAGNILSLCGREKDERESGAGSYMGRGLKSA